MKFRCERDTLVEALASAGRAVANRGGALPVLSGVRAELTGDRLRLTGSDLELTIEIEITVAGEADGVERPVFEPHAARVAAAARPPLAARRVRRVRFMR